MPNLRGPTPNPPAGVVLLVAVMLVLATGIAAADRVDVAGGAGGSGGADQPDVVVGPGDRLPPRPAEITTAHDPPEGEVAFSRQVVWMDLAAGEAGQPDLVVVNGSERSLALDLEPRPVAADPDGAPIALPPDPAETGALPSAVDLLTLAEDTVHLDPGEQAVLRPSVAVPDGAADGVRLVALHATTPAGEQPVAISLFLAVDVGAADEVAAPEIAVGLVQRGTSAVASVSLASGESVDAVEGAVRVRGWWGATVARTDLPGTLLLPDTPRTLPIEVTTPWVPGRYTAEVTVEGRTGETAEATGSAWLWRWEAAVAVAALLLVLTLALLLSLVRGARRR